MSSGPTFHWIGEGSCNDSLNRTYYNKFGYGHNTIELGDCVYLLPEDDSKPKYIARIQSAYEEHGAAETERFCIEIQWLERSCNLPENVRYHLYEQEVVEQPLVDVSLIACIDRKANVICAPTLEHAMASVPAGEREWHLIRYHYEPSTRSLGPLPRSWTAHKEPAAKRHKGSSSAAPTQPYPRAVPAGSPSTSAAATGAPGPYAHPQPGSAYSPDLLQSMHASPSPLMPSPDITMLPAVPAMHNPMASYPPHHMHAYPPHPMHPAHMMHPPSMPPPPHYMYTFPHPMQPHMQHQSMSPQAQQMYSRAQPSKGYPLQASPPDAAPSPKAATKPAKHSSSGHQSSSSRQQSSKASEAAPAKRSSSSSSSKSEGKAKPRYKRRVQEGLVCLECGANSTPQWREGPKGPKTLCNACGVRYIRMLTRLGYQPGSQAAAALTTVPPPKHNKPKIKAHAPPPHVSSMGRALRAPGSSTLEPGNARPVPSAGPGQASYWPAASAAPSASPPLMPEHGQQRSQAAADGAYGEALLVRHTSSADMADAANALQHLAGRALSTTPGGRQQHQEHALVWEEHAARPATVTTAADLTGACLLPMQQCRPQQASPLLEMRVSAPAPAEAASTYQQQQHVAPSRPADQPPSSGPSSPTTLLVPHSQSSQEASPDEEGLAHGSLQQGTSSGAADQQQQQQQQQGHTLEGGKELVIPDEPSCRASDAALQLEASLACAAGAAGAADMHARGSAPSHSGHSWRASDSAATSSWQSDQPVSQDRDLPMDGRPSKDIVSRFKRVLDAGKPVLQEDQSGSREHSEVHTDASKASCMA